MTHRKFIVSSIVCYLFFLALSSCSNQPSSNAQKLISQLNLRRGEIISCGSASGQFGSANFEITANEKVQNDFNVAIELLHSFEYDEAEKEFAKIIDEDPNCAMAYWGVAMSSFHALWTPPTIDVLLKGAKAIEIAQSIKNKSHRESDYINALGMFYKDFRSKDHVSRCVEWEKAMQKVHADYPNDQEAAIFYALSLDASADPRDTSYAKQKKAGAILQALYTTAPNHPGIIHYIIHTYDYPGLAVLGLPAARRYATVAPSSAHALHMPSHIFSRLGLWDESINSNLQSVDAAKCYAQQAGIRGHWDEELHGMDYLVYAYLQKRDNINAKKLVDYLEKIDTVQPANFKVAYAFAAIPSRFALENKNWKDAATLTVHSANFSWNAFPWQEAIIHFTRLVGNAHLHNWNETKNELTILERLRDTLEKQKDRYKATEVSIQVLTGKAWILFESGKKQEAITMMSDAADVEDRTGKHPVTPNEVLPARELLADMYLQMNDAANALRAYNAVLSKCPNRYNSKLGAIDAAQKLKSQGKVSS